MVLEEVDVIVLEPLVEEVLTQTEQTEPMELEE